MRARWKSVPFTAGEKVLLEARDLYKHIASINTVGGRRGGCWSSGQWPLPGLVEGGGGGVGGGFAFVISTVGSLKRVQGHWA